MSAWADVLRIIAEEAGDDVAVRIEERVRVEFGGLRITISKRPQITAELVHAAAPGRPRVAARKLGIHPSTAYRVLKRWVYVR